MEFWTPDRELPVGYMEDNATESQFKDTEFAMSSSEAASNLDVAS